MGDVLQDLVGVDDVEATVGKLQAVNVAHHEVDGGDPTRLGLGSGQIENLFGDLHRRDASRRDPRGEISGQRPRAAAHVQEGHSGPKSWQQVRG